MPKQNSSIFRLQPPENLKKLKKPMNKVDKIRLNSPNRYGLIPAKIEQDRTAQYFAYNHLKTRNPQKTCDEIRLNSPNRYGLIPAKIEKNRKKKNKKEKNRTKK